MHFRSLVLSGTVERAWIDGLVDAALESEWTAFDKEYREPELLAQLVPPAKPAGATAPGAFQFVFPDLVTPEQDRRIDEILRGDPARGLAEPPCARAPPARKDAALSGPPHFQPARRRSVAMWATWCSWCQA